MVIKEISKSEFDSFSKTHVLGSFFQSSTYGTLLGKYGYTDMYVGGKKVGNNVHYELAPGEEKLIPFSVDKENTDPVIFTTKYKVLSI